MKKIFVKDKENRQIVKQFELKYFILKQISANATRWNALYELTNINKGSKTVLSNRCVKTVNKKTFHKFSNFSRMVFLKLIKAGEIAGMRKSSW